MMRFEVHRLFNSQVADVPGRRRIEVMMSFRKRRVVRGQVPYRPIDGGSEYVDVVLE